MNALGLILFWIFTPLCITSACFVAWAFIDLFRGVRMPPVCDCGRRILREGEGILDNSDCQLHTVALCMPEREVIWHQP